MYSDTNKIKQLICHSFSLKRHSSQIFDNFSFIFFAIKWKNYLSFEYVDEADFKISIGAVDVFLGPGVASVNVGKLTPQFSVLTTQIVPI